MQTTSPSSARSSLEAMPTRSGFTLVEVVIATVATTLLLSAAGLTTRIGIRASAEALDRTHQMVQSQRVLTQIEALLSSAGSSTLEYVGTAAGPGPIASSLDELRAYFDTMAAATSGQVSSQAKQTRDKVGQAITDMNKTPAQIAGAKGCLDGARSNLIAMLDNGKIDAMEGQDLLDTMNKLLAQPDPTVLEGAGGADGGVEIQNLESIVTSADVLERALPIAAAGANHLLFRRKLGGATPGYWPETTAIPCSFYLRPLTEDPDLHELIYFDGSTRHVLCRGLTGAEFHRVDSLVEVCLFFRPRGQKEGDALAPFPMRRLIVVRLP